MEEGRMNPEAILDRITSDEENVGKGKLKIFFGYAAGIGKTYTMLLAAHEEKNAGIDVVAYAQNLLFRRLGYAIDRAMITGTVAGNSIQGLDEVKTEYKDACRVKTAAPDTLTIEDLAKVAADMETVYQSGAKWVMARADFQKVFALKDGSGRQYLTRDVVNDVVTYRLFGLEVLINDAAKNIYLVNFAHAYAGMIKKDTELKTITSDRASALAGTVTLVLDTYIDAKIVQPKAIRYLAVTSSEQA